MDGTVNSGAGASPDKPDRLVEIKERFESLESLWRMAEVDQDDINTLERWSGTKSDLEDDMLNELGPWLIAEVERLRSENKRLLGSEQAIEQLLARRPALDDFPTAYKKIAHALKTAGEVDALRARVTRLDTVVDEALTYCSQDADEAAHRQRWPIEKILRKVRPGSLTQSEAERAL